MKFFISYISPPPLPLENLRPSSARMTRFVIKALSVRQINSLHLPLTPALANGNHPQCSVSKISTHFVVLTTSWALHRNALRNCKYLTEVRFKLILTNFTKCPVYNQVLDITSVPQMHLNFKQTRTMTLTFALKLPKHRCLPHLKSVVYARL